MDTKKARKKLTIIALVFLFFVALTSGAIADRFLSIPALDKLFPQKSDTGSVRSLDQKVVREESVVIDIVENVSPSVVTVAIETPRRTILEYRPFGGGFSQRYEGGEEQDIGSGFIVSEDGLIITNKHVVDSEGAIYKVITQDDKEYEVVKISTDPSNDIAILKIDADNLVPVELGSSKDLKVGQFVIAIGTALGEFRHTVTTGVVSGLGRGIIAGSVFEGYVERLDDVIQTDAAINPGNSGGPLLNSAGQVIGINVATAGAENIAFAIPIDVVKDGLDHFNRTGKFVSKPFLGVEYDMISERSAILNDVPEGAYIINVVSGSPAENAGIQEKDIITEMDGQRITEDSGGLADVIAEKKPGDRVEVKVWRRDGEDGEEMILYATLSEFSE
ncbi:trypsin-like peptidase domain-containing protein [Candidatus Woesebacteria bacterium]|nr:trypsin-like peptidase domain-containing protein [Candidatus Woesebacteria bacterium]